MRVHLYWAGILSMIFISVSPLQAQQDPLQAHSLLEHATKLADASHWADPCYLWYDDHTLLTFTGDRHAKGYYRFALLDIRTGRSQPWTQLDQKWTRYLTKFTRLNDGNDYQAIIHQSLSPDQKWLLVFTHIASHDPGIHITALSDGWGLIALTGKDIQSPPIDGPLSTGAWASPIWSKDSRAFALVEYHQGHTQTYSVPTCALLPDAPSPEAPNTALFDTGTVWALGFRDDGRLLLGSATVSTEEPTRMNLVSVGLNKRASPPDVTPVSLPKQLSLHTEALSPDGKQIIWIFWHYTDSGVDRGEFWQSRSDGQAMRRLGWIPPEYNPILQWNYGPTDIEWAPDNRHFSFLYKDALYLFPADLPRDATSGAKGH
jgi:hypothetical protein